MNLLRIHTLFARDALGAQCCRAMAYTMQNVDSERAAAYEEEALIAELIAEGPPEDGGDASEDTTPMPTRERDGFNYSDLQRWLRSDL